jgi:hypothetical protein
MTSFKADNRKSNALLFLGLTFWGLTYFTLTSNSPATKAVWTTFLTVAGLSSVCLALIPSYKVSVSDNELILKNRLGVFNKRIRFNDIKRVKVINQDYPVTLYRNTILHLLLWDKKFNRFKQIQLFDVYGGKLVTIDGQSIDDNDFNRLVKMLKSNAAHNKSFVK